MRKGKETSNSPAAAGTQESGTTPRRVIVVDLDQTLILGDTLHEQIVRLVLGKPWLLPRLLLSLLRGKAATKAFCAEHIALDVATLPACPEVLAFVREEQARGSYVVLCSAADKSVADNIAAHFGLFDEVVATEGGTNLKGKAKADVLCTRFPEGFIYAGDHADDIAVWAHAAGIILVGVTAAVETKARALGIPVVAIFPHRKKRGNSLRLWARALRLHHLSKNVLMFAPLVLAHQWFDRFLVTRTLLGFVLLLAVTSASYLINDLADLDADRRHATKRYRAIASGAMPIAMAALVPVFVLPGALAGAFLLDFWFGATLASYLGLTLAYTFRLKQLPLLDVFIIAVLFTLRLMMGAILISDALPVWLATFSMFFFFSLAMAKRHAEVVRAMRKGGDSLISRGYDTGDWPLMLGLGLASGLGSLIILVLYLVNEAFRKVGYGNPEFLWLIVPLVAIWIGRIWLLTHRGQMHDDPVYFAISDRPSQTLAAFALICFLVAV